MRKHRKSDRRDSVSKDSPIARFPHDAQAWSEGYLAGRRGIEVAFNPYEFGTPEARAWILGLSAGKMKPLRLVS